MRPLLSTVFLLSLLACESEPEEESTDRSSSLPDRDLPGDPPEPDSPTDPGDEVAQVEISPERLELGTLDPRCPNQVELQLTATGETPTGEFTVAVPEGWNATLFLTSLEPGESTTVQLTWVGSMTDPSGEVHLDFAELERVTVPVLATLELPSEELEVDLSGRAEADLLLAVDKSCNMDDMARLEPHWPTLRDRLADWGIALRMTSVVEDDACVLGETVVLDDSLDDEAFRAALWDQQKWDGSYGAYTERLLDMSSRALVASCNAGFVQGDAPLHVLAFSDEPDQSELDWSVYVEEMEAIPDPGVPLTVHGMGGGLSEDCWAMHYAGVIEATEATRGVFLDFCSPDWDASLTELADGMAAASRRLVLPTLSDRGGEPVAVRAGGVEQTGWSWDGSRYLDLPEDFEETELTVEMRLPAVCE